MNNDLLVALFLALGLFTVISPLAFLGEMSPIPVLIGLCIFSLIILLMAIINFNPEQGTLMDVVLLKESGVFITNRILSFSYSLFVALLAVLPITFLRYKGRNNDRF